MYTTCTVPFVRVAILVCVWAAARLQHFHTSGQQYAGPSSKVIPKPSTMASETHSSSGISITWMPWRMIPPGTRNIPPDHPTQQGSPAATSFAGRVTAQESVIVTLLQPENLFVSSFVCLFPIDFGTTWWRVGMSKFWSCVSSNILKLHKTVCLTNTSLVMYINSLCTYILFLSVPCRVLHHERSQE